MFLVLLVGLSLCLSVGLVKKIVNGLTRNFYQMCVSRQGAIDWG